VLRFGSSFELPMMCRYLVHGTGGTVAIIAWLGCGDGARSMGMRPDSLLKAEIFQRVAEDQAIRDTLALQLRTTGTVAPDLVLRMQAVDSANIAWLRPLLDSVGIPSKATIGSDGIASLLLLIQHADQDTALQGRALPLVELAFRAGDVRGQEFAMLTDRVLKARGQAQRYGTQATIVDGIVEIDPIEDSSSVDQRRAELGLPSLVEYKRVVDSAYARGPGL
jgi:Family of unknown function (DUF6624)